MVRFVLATWIGLVPALALAGSSRLVLLPVVVHSAASDSEYVSRGLADMLSARIEQHGRLEVVRKEDPTLATTDLERALEAAQAERADFVLFGSFTQFGDGASLDLQCAPVAGGAEAPRHIFIQSGTMGEIIPRLDELADKLDRYVGGDAASEGVASGAGAEPGAVPNGDALAELQRRLEVLEQAVFPPVAEAVEDPPTTEAVAQTPES
jgi:TolB-like protein